MGLAAGEEFAGVGVGGEAKEINKEENKLKAAVMVAALLKMLNITD